jgi:hypothetical protein
MPYAFAVPILPGKTEAARQLMQQVLGPRRQEYDDLQRRFGSDRERYFVQTSPQGDMMLLYGDGNWRAPENVLDLDRNPFDQWFRDQMLEITGIDVTEFLGEPSEMIGEWHPK